MRPKKPDGTVLRIIDANTNRLKEGLRVCEDIFRFILNAKISRARLPRGTT